MSTNSDLQHSFENCIGRSCVYIESGDACVCTVEAVSVTADSFSARFRIVPDSFKCRLRVIRTVGEDLIECVLEEPPFGNDWGVSAFDKQFYLELEKDYWYLGFLWGSGVRFFFQPSFVGRFLAGDIAWINEFYDDESDQDYDEEEDDDV
jgi:hypothetical protein